MCSSLDGIVIYTHQQKVYCLKSDPVGDNNLQMLEGDIEEWRKFKPQESEFIFELNSCQSENLKYVVVLRRSSLKKIRFKAGQLPSC